MDGGTPDVVRGNRMTGQNLGPAITTTGSTNVEAKSAMDGLRINRSSGVLRSPFKRRVTSWWRVGYGCDWYKVRILQQESSFPSSIPSFDEIIRVNLWYSITVAGHGTARISDQCEIILRMRDSIPVCGCHLLEGEDARHCKSVKLNRVGS